MNDNFKAQLAAAIPALRGYAMSLVRSASDADDLVQETLMRAWRSRHTYQEDNHFKAWAFRILLNVVKSEAAKRRFKTVDLDSPAALSVGSQPEQEWSTRYAEVRAALEHISPLAREALMLIVSSGLSYEDAAAAVGVPVGTMKSRVARARDALAQYVDVPRTDARGTATRKEAPPPPPAAAPPGADADRLRCEGASMRAPVASAA